MPCLNLGTCCVICVLICSAVDSAFHYSALPLCAYVGLAPQLTAPPTHNYTKRPSIAPSATAEWPPDSDNKKNNKLYNHHSLFFTVCRLCCIYYLAITVFLFISGKKKLQHKKIYGTTYDVRYIYQRKSAVQLTSVGLAHACPN